jgi:peptide/nickel transport system permease protein
LLRKPVAVVCLAFILVMIAVAIIAPFAMPEVASQNAGKLSEIRQGPSGSHFLGTDALGRDLLDRLLVGTRITFIGVAETLVVALFIGVPLGLAAGFLGGWTDRLVSATADVLFALPAIALILVVLSVYPQSMTAAMITVGVLLSPGVMRVVRSVTLPVAQEPYIASAQIAGVSGRDIIARHVLPRIAGPVIVQASLISATALIVETGLGFLNLVVAPPAPSWGSMVGDGASAISIQPWLIWPPGIAIALAVMALGLLGDAVRDATTERWAPATTMSGRQARKRKRAAEVRPLVAGPAQHPTELANGSKDADQDSEVLCVKSLTVVGRRGSEVVPILRDVSFTVGAGEAVGLVGESGSGKSMTALSVIGLLPSAVEVESGSILFAGSDLATCDNRAFNRVRGSEIGLISQDPMASLNPAVRVGSQIADVIKRHKGCSSSEAVRRTHELLDLVRLPEPRQIARRYPHELSGGMAQRVSIARALAGDPRLIIADEATTALDVTVQAEILALLRDLLTERSVALLFVSHDWGVVADICDRAVVMYAGEVVEDAEIVPIFQEPKHPYTEALLAANPQQSANSAATLATIPGAVPETGRWPAGCHFHPRCQYASAECTTGEIPIVDLSFDRRSRCLHIEKIGHHAEQI